jgi:hypothetical protein
MASGAGDAFDLIKQMFFSMVEQMLAKVIESGLLKIFANIATGGGAGAAGGGFDIMQSIFGFASGSWKVPKDNLALVHQGEIVIPAAEAAKIRAGQAQLGPPGGAFAVPKEMLPKFDWVVPKIVIAKEALPKFDSGSWSVPKTMVALVHKGEIIIPAPEAAGVRSGHTGIGQTNVTANIHVHGVADGPAFFRTLKANEAQLLKWLREAGGAGRR